MEPRAGKASSFKIEFPGDSRVRNELKTKLQNVKVALREQTGGGAITNTDTRYPEQCARFFDSSTST